MEGDAIQFIYRYSESSPKISVSLHGDSGLQDVLEAFEQFLKAAGYPMDGHIEIIEENKND